MERYHIVLRSSDGEERVYWSYDSLFDAKEGLSNMLEDAIFLCDYDVSIRDIGPQDEADPDYWDCARNFPHEVEDTHIHVGKSEFGKQFNAKVGIY